MLNTFVITLQKDIRPPHVTHIVSRDPNLETKNWFKVLRRPGSLKVTFILELVKETLFNLTNHNRYP